MTEKENNKTWQYYVVNEKFNLGVGVNVFYEADVPYLEIFTKDFMTVHEQGVKVPLEALSQWIAANVSGAEYFKRTFAE